MAQMADPQPFDVLPLINELACLEKPGWRSSLRHLRRSGLPLNEGGDEGSSDAAASESAGAAGGDEAGGGAGSSEAAPSGEGGAGGSGEPETFDREYVESLRKESARYRTRARELEEAEQARKDAELSDLERERKGREEAEGKVARLERDAIRRKVLDAHKLDADMAEFLTGADEDAMVEQAKKLSAKVTTRKPTIEVPGGPQGGGSDKPMTADQARSLAASNPAEFNRLVDAGEISPAVLQGK